jgi:hypothetical protein
MIAHFALSWVEGKEMVSVTKNTLYCSGYKKTGKKKLEILFKGSSSD